MKGVMGWVLGGLVIIAGVGIMCPRPTPKFGFESLAAARAASKTDGKPIIAVFGAEWCGPCKVMEAETFADPDVIEDMKPFHVTHIDIDTDEGGKAASEFSVISVPTTVFIGPSGRELLRVNGQVPTRRFREAIKAAKSQLD